jgi:lipoprotein NlpI
MHDADTVLNLEPKFAAAYAMRGLMAFETGQFDRAREQFKQTLAIAPDYEDGLWAQQIAQAKLALLDQDIP